MSHIEDHYDGNHEAIRVNSGECHFPGTSSATNAQFELLDASSPQRFSASFEPTKSYGQTRSEFELDFEKRYVSWLLSRHAGNISAAAREAKMDRKHLHDLAKKHGLRGQVALARR
jgi:DNA-binding NtrC family response regulator